MSLRNTIREALRRPGGKSCSCFADQNAPVLDLINKRARCNGVCEDAVERVATAIEQVHDQQRDAK